MLLLGLYVLADTLKLPFAQRILDLCGMAINAQFVLGALVNIALGIAAIAMAAWFVWHPGPAWRVLGSAAVAILGLWRIARGAAILQGAYEEWRSWPADGVDDRL
jgi:hypothetical protein